MVTPRHAAIGVIVVQESRSLRDHRQYIMKWSVTVARVGGTRVKIHLTFLLLLVWIAVGYYSRGGAAEAVEGTAFILTLFLCVLLHELGHVAAARRYGITTPDITLLPIGGVARLTRMPEKPSQEIVVALAGPAVNLVIALLLFLIIGRLSGPEEVSALQNPRLDFAQKIMSANIALLLFNLIPAFPMDGGRVLRALLAIRVPYVRATSIAATIGQGLALLFGFLGLLYNPLLIFVALFVYLAASQEAAAVRVRASLSGLLIRDGMLTNFRALPEGSRVGDAVHALLHTMQRDVPVVDSAGVVRGMLPNEALITALRDGRIGQPVVDLMQRDIPLLRDTEPFEKGLALLRQAPLSTLPVVDMNGRLIGLITAGHVGQVLSVEGAASHDTPRG